MGLALVGAPARLGAQDHTALQYRQEQMACVAIHQQVRSVVETTRGERGSEEAVGWSGDLVLRASADSGAMGIVGWFEDLDVWRDTPDGHWSPATAGLIGGRYRGTLDARGAFTRTSAPFIPEAIGAIAALETALDELWPPAPPTAMAIGGTGTDPAGWHFDRLTDTTWSGVGALRFRVLQSDTTPVSVEWADGQTSHGESIEVEEGRLVWDPTRGPLLWSRRIRTTVTFPEAEVTADAVQTSVRQERLFLRGDDLPPERCRAP